MTNTEHAIVCIHGLWMRNAVFWYLRNALRRSGTQFYLFDYASIRKPMSQHVRALQQYIQGIQAKRIDFIAHSLGGLLLFEYFSLVSDQRFNKTVLLGTPLQGSATAKAYSSTVLKPLLGANKDILLKGITEWSAPGPVMMIAGKKSFGMGAVAGALPGENDGTVAVDETQHPQLSAHYVINASHSSMMCSHEAVQLIRSFI